MKKQVKEWIENNVNPKKVMESFLWYTFSKVSDEDMIYNLKNFRELFEKSMIDDEMEWIEKRNEKPETKQQYKDEVKKEIEKTTDRNIKHIQKVVKKLHLDKDGWKKRLTWL
jgi:hypothetical protein